MSEGDRSAAGLWRQPPVRLNWWSAGGVRWSPKFGQVDKLIPFWRGMRTDGESYTEAVFG
jgi:hypothetical protein